MLGSALIVVRQDFVRAARSTMPLILSTFPSRIGQVLSVATHCASVMPQPQLQRAAFAASSAPRFCFASSPEKSTTLISASPYAMFDICETP